MRIVGLSLRSIAICIPMCLTCGSSKTSFKLYTGVCGTSLASSRSTQTDRGCSLKNTAKVLLSSS